jgi:predicted PP-loop superfamily ATPase
MLPMNAPPPNADFQLDGPFSGRKIVVAMSGGVDSSGGRGARRAQPARR